MAEYDAVIVGAGVLGLATAYYIKKQNPDHHVLVVERLSGPGQGSTAKSAGMFRVFFYSKTNLALAHTSVEFYKFLQEEKGVDLNIRWVGYLWLFDDEGYEKIKPVLDVISARGLEYKVFEARELEDMMGLRTDLTGDEEAELMGLSNVDQGVFVPRAGSIDVDALVRFYEKAFLELGGEIAYNTEVRRLIVEPKRPLGLPGEPFIWQDVIVRGVETSSGEIKAEKVVIAAGAWSHKLLNPIGLECFFRPKKRQLFSIRVSGKPKLEKLLWTKGFNEEGCMPFTILPGPRVYLKPAPEEEAIWLSFADELGRPFEEDPELEPAPEREFYEYGLYQVAVKYFPQLEGCRPDAAWAGYYAENPIDHQPVIFEEAGVIIVGGASGSGIMKADAIGRIAAALYSGQEEAELFGGEAFRVSDLSIRERSVEPEKLVI